MVSNDVFLDIVRDNLDRDLRAAANASQFDAVTFSGGRILQIVAGPGSGKTTVLVLRALRAVFVDDILPEEILITTFTRKAARELRTRWLDWGLVVQEVVARHCDTRHIDLNRCLIDTLDSTVQQVLTEYRPVGTLAPVVAETSASNLIFKRVAFQEIYHSSKDILDQLLARYSFDGRPPRNQGDALQIAKRLVERLVQDLVLEEQYEASGHGQRLLVQIARIYSRQALDTNIFDYAQLERLFLSRLRAGDLNEWRQGLRVIMVDEYQDTNPLQEAIYFELMATASVTIVGDDDQAMYRFRGGAVELFTQFSRRCNTAGRDAYRVDMVRNFRSRPELVEFYNQHLSCDPGFAAARITPSKPQVIAHRGSGGIRVLGMFRRSPEILAADLSRFISTLIRERNFTLANPGGEIRLPPAGDLGDIAFLAHTIEEVKYDRFGQTSEVRFPGHLRAALMSTGMNVFNPRGQALRAQPNVGTLLGLVVLAIDPDASLIEEIRPTNEARYYLASWRQLANQFVAGNPPPNDGRGLAGFLQDWQSAARGVHTQEFPADWPVLELVFKLITWIPDFQIDSEHQVWLEAVARIVAGAAMGSPYRMQLLQNTAERIQGEHVRRSRASLLRDALVAIAEDEVDVDEEIMPSVPRDLLQMMTIHQAKGLEFPMVIVDVGSHFTRNHPMQRFLRYPGEISTVVRAEVDIEPFLPSPLRGSREELDRTFDDLVRLYYVAYSRPQSVLLLVGCERCLVYGTGPGNSRGTIPNIALGWRRDGTWSWRQPRTGPPPVMVNPPMRLI